MRINFILNFLEPTDMCNDAGLIMLSSIYTKIEGWPLFNYDERNAIFCAVSHESMFIFANTLRCEQIIRETEWTSKKV